MEPNEINRLIAEKVMKFYTLKESTRWWSGEHGRDNLTSFSYIPTKQIHECDYFDPYHNISYAMMALEKFKNYNLHKRTWHDGKLGYRCSMESSVYYSSEWVDTPQAAICLAIVEAVKGGDVK